MNNSELTIRLEADFPKAVISVDASPVEITIEKEMLRPFMQHLKGKLGFNYLMFNSAVDKMADNKIEAVYLLCENNKTQLKVKVLLDRENPGIDTISDIYLTAEWHERETAELFGITFINHPDPRKLLLPDDFKGFPLRKDFKDDFMLPLPSGKNKE